MTLASNPSYADWTQGSLKVGPSIEKFNSCEKKFVSANASGNINPNITDTDTRRKIFMIKRAEPGI